MPVEAERKLGKKKIKTPAGDIWVPVIIEISFTDDPDRAQEYRYTVDNNADGDRDTHVAWVGTSLSSNATENADRTAETPDDCIAVERIDVYRHIDPADRYWETAISFDNKTYDPNGSKSTKQPYFVSHEKTHIVTYRFKPPPPEPDPPPDPKQFVGMDVELIDEFVIVGERGQETHFYLSQNPKDDDEANQIIKDDTLEVTDSDNGVDPPYRTDPFQNIVKIREPLTVFWAYQAESILPGPAVGGGYHFRSMFPQPGGTLPNGRVMVVTGSPTVSDVIFNPGPGTNFLAFPWWLVGPDTDHSSGSSPGYHNYDMHEPSAVFSHSWPFFGYTYQDGNAPAIYKPAGALSVSFGPISLTIDGIAWELINLHASFFAINQDQFGASPGSMTQLPFFSATFDPP